METRADFYNGTGHDAQWLGSIVRNGGPASVFEHHPEMVTGSPVTQEAWNDFVVDTLADDEDARMLYDGWPWSWPTSHTTEYTYALVNGYVRASRFGQPMFTINAAADNFGDPGPIDHCPHDEEPECYCTLSPLWPEMIERPVLTWGPHSGTNTPGRATDG